MSDLPTPEVVSHAYLHNPDFHAAVEVIAIVLGAEPQHILKVLDGTLIDASLIARRPCEHGRTMPHGDNVTGHAPVDNPGCSGWRYPDLPGIDNPANRQWWEGECDFMWQTLGMYEYGGDE